MTRKAVVGAAVLVAIAAASVGAGAQTKTIPFKTESQTLTIEAIDFATREVTAKKADGTYQSLYVPASIKRFDSLKIGDKVSVKYYENLVLQVKKPGEPAVDTSSFKTVPAEGGAMAGTMARQRTVTVTIAAIDMAVPSITFTGPKDWKYSSRVQDKEALSKVKVGDKVDITWTEAAVVAIEDAKP